jgi:uncharacterized membrane protein
MMRSAGEESEETVEAGMNLSNLFFLLLITGFVLIFVGIAVILIAIVFCNASSASVGVVIFIGPFPIVIGTGPDIALIVLFSIIIAVLSIVAFLVLKRRIARFGD